MQKVEKALESLSQDGEGSALHQLALMTAIRMAFTEDDLQKDEDENNEQKRDILINTDIREIIHKILTHTDVTEELYFLKHESLWVLISFSMSHEEVC